MTQMYDITITFTVSKLTDKNEAQEMGTCISEHILDTFNDDGTIHPLTTVKVKETPTG